MGFYGRLACTLTDLTVFNDIYGLLMNFMHLCTRFNGILCGVGHAFKELTFNTFNII